MASTRQIGFESIGRNQLKIIARGRSEKENVG
jgi:hypothetical protein